MKDEKNIEKVSAELSMDSLKVLFNSIVGRPDSKTKLFYDPVEIKPNDLIDLNKKISEKLFNHQILDVVTQVNVFYKNNEIEQYGYWDTFESKNWKTSKETSALTIKWDFMVKIPKHPVPQPHTLTVKVKAEFAPLEMFRFILSEDPGDLDKLEIENAPIMGRVDYLNEVLAEELLFIIEEWVSALIKPSYNFPLYRFIKSYKKFIQTFVHYSIPLSLSVLAGGYFIGTFVEKYGAESVVTVGILSSAFFWLLIIMALLAIAFKYGEFLSDMISNSIKNYGKHTPIKFTNGDQNKINKSIRENKESVVAIVTNFVFALVFDITSAYITFLILK